MEGEARRWRTGEETLRKIAKIKIYRVQRKVEKMENEREKERERTGKGEKWRILFELRATETKRKLEIVIHLALNIGITRMPSIPTFIPRGAFIYTEIFGRLPGTRHSSRCSPPPPFFPSFNSHKEDKKEVEATARNSSPFVGYQTGAKPMSPVSFSAEIPRDPRLFLFFSFRLLSFLSFPSRQPFRSEGAISLSIVEHELRRVGRRRNAERKGTRSFRS